MIINKLSLTNFRNYRDLTLNLSPSLNVFIGRNAQGKTNILEAIRLASIGSSRASKDSELIRWGERSAFIRLEFTRSRISHSLAIEISAGARRRFLLDGTPIAMRDLIGRLPTVMFSPDDLFIFKAAPAMRRKFLDSLLSQASPGYFANLSRYNRLLAQRNSLLRQIRDGAASPDQLNLWDQPLASAAASLTLARIPAVQALSAAANSFMLLLSNRADRLAISYSLHDFLNFDPNNPASSYLHALLLSHSSHISRASTSLGPHLDDLLFSLNDRPLRSNASQGQIRSASLALKLSEFQLLKAAIGSSPALLLDDVMSELDSARRAALSSALLSNSFQALATATDHSCFPAPAAALFRVVNDDAYDAAHFYR